jgi:hypothetical protein
MCHAGEQAGAGLFDRGHWQHHSRLLPPGVESLPKHLAAMATLHVELRLLGLCCACEPVGEAQHERFPAQAAAAGLTRDRSASLVHDLQEIALDRALAEAEARGDLGALVAGAVEGENFALSLG